MDYNSVKTGELNKCGSKTDNSVIGMRYRAGREKHGRENTIETNIFMAFLLRHLSGLVNSTCLLLEQSTNDLVIVSRHVALTAVKFHQVHIARAIY